METKHTPGPWVLVEPQAQSDGSVYPACIEGGARQLEICKFGESFADNDAMAEAKGDVRSKRANARLIVEAPAMLEMLLRIQHSGVTLQFTLADTLAALLARIAKG